MSNAARAASGAAWAVGTRIAAQGTQFALGIVLARVLVPADFGLAASVYAVTGLALVFLDLGLGTAIIRWEAPTQRQLSTVFWVNIANGVLFELIVIAISPALASFYGHPVLRTLAPVAGLSFLLTIGVVHQALLTRAMRFRLVSLITAGGSMLGSAATLVLAVAGFGAMSLAIGPVVACAATSIGMMAASAWRPSRTFEWGALKKLWAFSSGLLGAQSTEYLSQNLDNVLLGRFYGPGVLGSYSRAFNLMLLPVNQITGALGSVLFPMLVRANSDVRRLTRAYERCAHVIFVIVAPVLTVMLVTAPDLVPVLWGTRWEATVVPLQWLCVAGLARVTTLSTGWLLQVVGKTGLMFRLALSEAGLTVLGIVGGISAGAGGVAAGVALASVLYLPLNLGITFRALAVSPRGLALRLLRSVSCIAVGACCIAVVQALLGDAPIWLRLLGGVSAGLAGFAGSVFLLDRALIKDVRSLRPRFAH